MNPENISGNGNGNGKLLRLLRPSIVVLCGPAACGKSTFAQRHFRPTQVISSDWARAHISDDERDQRFNAQAFALVYFLTEQRLTVNRLCVVDSTALTAPARKELLDLAKKHQVPTTLILFNMPLEACIERDKKRERSVGTSVVERQYQAFELTKDSIRQEGFDQVIEYQDGDLEKVQIEILFRPVARPAPRPQRPDPRAPRRFERSAQPPTLRPSRPGNNCNTPLTASVPAVAQPATAPRPVTAPGPDSTPKSATTPPGQAPLPEAGTRPASPVPPSGSPGVAKKPFSPPQAAVSPKPAPPAAQRPVPVGAQTSDAS